MMTGEPEAHGESAGARPPREKENTTEREDTVEDRNERDGNPEESGARQERAIRAFFGFLNRHPGRRDQFIRSVLDAGTPRETVEQALDDEDLFVAAVLRGREEDAGDLMTATAAGPSEV